MPRPDSPSTAKRARDRRALVDALDGAEAKQLLATLLDAHPELLTEVADLAEAELGAVTAEYLAEEVAFALEGLSVEDVWERAGTQPDGSYLEPTDAAWEVVEEAVAPFIADLTRRVELGRRAEATALCQGVLLSLYSISHGEGEFLDGHASDTLEEAAASAVEAWKKGSRDRAGSGVRARELAAMRRFLSDALPDWESFLRRTIGPIHKKRTR
jgi:hypothetical protein